MKKYLILIALILPLVVNGQNESSLQRFSDKTSTINTNGMRILGSWSIANMAAGGVGMATSTGSNYYFHEMNFYWNTVNLAIAGLGYFGEMKVRKNPQDLNGTLGRHHKVQKSLIFNAGLDLAYIASGFYLMERARRPDVNQEQLKGYGQSLILQGGFLFLFDAVMFGIHQQNGKKIPSLLQNAQIGVGSIGWAIPINP
jgi:hypothetical protein